jgi:hypothetical protein
LGFDGRQGILEVGMTGWFGKVQEWLAGKKTIIGGCLIIAAGVAGVALGKVTSVEAMAVVGVGVSICGWSAKTNRYQVQVLGALEAVALAGAAYRSGDTAGAVRTLAQTAAKDAVKIATTGTVAP